MRFTKTVCVSVLTLATAFSAAPALAADTGDPKFLWEDRPACPWGQWAVWVDRPGTPPVLDLTKGGKQWTPGQPPFQGWECQPIKLQPIEP